MNHLADVLHGMDQSKLRNTSLSTKPRLILSAVAAVLIAGVIFEFAQRLHWTLGWMYVGTMATTVVLNLVCVIIWNPDLIERRMSFGRGWKAWDIVWTALATPLMIMVFATPAMTDTSGVAPTGAWLLGIAIFIPSWAMLTWSMAVNPFFEKIVRIQTEHDHHTIDSGPYGIVRHPGYVGFSGWFISTPLMLGSTWAFLPALLTVFAFTARTALEDRTLQAELPGYAEYAIKVRFRLIPGVW